MVQLTRLDGSTLYLSVSAIAAVEETPSTVIRMREGEVVRVKETAAEVVERVTDARANVITRAIERAMSTSSSSVRQFLNSGS